MAAKSHWHARRLPRTVAEGTAVALHLLDSQLEKLIPKVLDFVLVRMIARHDSDPESHWHPGRRVESVDWHQWFLNVTLWSWWTRVRDWMVVQYRDRDTLVVGIIYALLLALVMRVVIACMDSNVSTGGGGMGCSLTTSRNRSMQYKWSWHAIR